MLKDEISRATQYGPAYRDYATPGDHDDSPFDNELLLTDRFYVTFRGPAQDQRLADLMKDRYTLVERVSDDTVLLQMERGDDPVTVVSTLAKSNADLEIEHDANHRMMPQQLIMPEDEGFGMQWHLKSADKGAMRCDAAWELLGHFGMRDVVICVTDAAFGIEDHPDFSSADKLTGFAYFCGNRLISSSQSGADRRELSVGNEMQIAHGTSCAAVATADADGKFSVGVAPGCGLYLVRLPHDGDGELSVADSHLSKVIRCVRDKVDIVSSSWGSSQPRSYWSRHARKVLRDAAITGGRRGKGLIFLWAAGNTDTPIASDFRSALAVPYEKIETGSGPVARETVDMKKDRHFVNQLVGIPNVLHIGASTKGGRRARYSNYGAGIELTGPSDNSDAPFFAECSQIDPERIITSTTGLSGPSRENQFGGTSAAAPMVAGVAALTISANVDLSASEVVTILRQSAERDSVDLTAYPPIDCVPNTRDVSPVKPFEIGAFTNNEQHPDAPWSPWLGHGRVDALRAVEMALSKKKDHH
ncbi:MAG TPA: S8 family serine peptidase [Thermoanaerobaculia bacterium]|nr:S8 family serine peptidase [Thermoanaerobaculia bacterium]